MLLTYQRSSTRLLSPTSSRSSSGTSMGGRTHWFNLGRKDWGYSSVGRASQTRYPTFVPYFVLFSTQNQAQSESVLENTKRTKPLDLLGLMRFWSGGGKGSRTPDLLNAISQQSKDDRRQGATEPHFSGLSDLLIFHEPHLPYCMHYVCLKPTPHPRQGNRFTLSDASATHSGNPTIQNISPSFRQPSRSCRISTNQK